MAAVAMMTALEDLIGRKEQQLRVYSDAFVLLKQTWAVSGVLTRKWIKKGGGLFQAALLKVVQQ